MSAHASAPVVPPPGARWMVAIHNGRVLAAVCSQRRYPWAVVHTGAHGSFATFHGSMETVRLAMAFAKTSLPTKQLVPTIEVQPPVRIGAPVEEITCARTAIVH